jgi:purine nucleosidase
MAEDAMQHVIVACDPGIDDALALLMLATLHRNQSLVLDSVFAGGGNVTAEQAAQNAAFVLDSAGLESVPVYEAADPVAVSSGQRLSAKQFHGGNGLGDLPVPISSRIVTSTDPGLELANRITTCPEAPSLLALCPLTTVALALRYSPGSLERLSRLVIMGGAFGNPGGNVTPWAEFNFFADPSAADAVVASGLNVEIVPLDVTESVPFLREDAGGLEPLASALVRISCDLHKRELGSDQSFLHDAVAAASLIDPSLANWRQLDVEIVTSLSHRGQVKWQQGKQDARKVASVSMDIDLARARQSILKLLSPLMLKTDLESR